VEGSSCARSFEETKGVNFQETFAPTMKWPTIRAMILVVVYQRWAIRHFDVKTSILNRKFHKEVFMLQPKGFVVIGKEVQVCKFKKNILWFEASKSKMTFIN